MSDRPAPATSPAIPALAPRLPVYLLLDVSRSMEGAPIEALRQGVQLFARQLAAQPHLRDRVWVRAITFASSATAVTPDLVRCDRFTVPELTLDGKTDRLDRALKTLQACMDVDTREAAAGPNAPLAPPVVLVFTNGQFTDGRGRLSQVVWRAEREAIVQRPPGGAAPAAIVPVGCGPAVALDRLRELAFAVPPAADAGPPELVVLGKDDVDFVALCTRALDAPSAPVGAPLPPHGAPIAIDVHGAAWEVRFPP